MVISWVQGFSAYWTLKGKEDKAKYEVNVEIEGPARPMMTDAGPVISEIGGLEGKKLSEVCGASSLEAVTLYLEGVIKRHLAPEDRLRRLHVLENDMFGAAL